MVCLESVAGTQFSLMNDDVAMQIEVKKAVPKNAQGGHGGGHGGGGHQSAPILKLFVGGTGEISDDEFRSHFEQYGGQLASWYMCTTLINSGIFYTRYL